MTGVSLKFSFAPLPLLWTAAAEAGHPDRKRFSYLPSVKAAEQFPCIWRMCGGRASTQMADSCIHTGLLGSKTAYIILMFLADRNMDVCTFQTDRGKPVVHVDTLQHPFDCDHVKFSFHDIFVEKR